jgi:phage terminase large subunit-like protein
MKGSAETISKAVSGQGKIDPLMALFNAFDLMARHPEAANGPSIYETQEPESLSMGDWRDEAFSDGFDYA